eukprot:4246396-Amphidinium_carterae.1
MTSTLYFGLARNLQALRLDGRDAHEQCGCSWPVGFPVDWPWQCYQMAPSEECRWSAAPNG